ncbi:PAS domain S-box protein [Pedobacter changchengzhani]|uniref:histidine kinase n=2 Tax=Pedobacter changchengzhani TaxID=2529274 RepID=A0A4R5MIH4_9SPHI|nr:PAS domain S-box protein [Pedobacter changchengzhani]
MADSAPVLIWISGLDKLCYFFNAGWLRFTGRAMDQELGNGWAEGVHPDDFDRCLKTYVTAFDGRADFTMEYRLKRHDGEYRWVTDNGVPRYLADGSFAGYIGTCVDVHNLLEDQRAKTELLNKKALQSEQELNEELASINEELASSNEELLVSNEQLSIATEKLSVLNLGLEEIVDTRTHELSISEHRYRNLVNSAPVAIATLTGRELTITSANEMMLQVWGKSSSILGETALNVLSDIRNEQFFQMLDEVFATGKSAHGNEVQAILQHEDELQESYFDFIYTPLKAQDGTTESIILVATDVTERVHSRNKVEYARNRVRSMVTTAPIGMTILQGQDLVIEIANYQMLQVWHRKDDVIGSKLWDVFPEIEKTEFKGILEDIFIEGKPFKVSEALSPHLETESYIDISYDPLFDHHGKVESILVTVVDITELVKGKKLVEQSQYDLQASNEELRTANEALTLTNENLEKVSAALVQSMADVRANEDRFRFMLNAIPQQVWTADQNGALNYVNDVVCKDFGFNSDQISGRGWQEFIHPEDLDNCLDKWRIALNSGQEYVVEFRLKFADGTYYWHLARALPFIEKEGVKLWIGTNTNIQAQKHNEELKDEFLSIASHELKTPLTSIKAFNQLMARTNKTEGFNLFIKKSSDQIYRLEKLIMDLLDVTKINAGKMSYNMETFNFREMLVATIESIQHTALNHEIIFATGEEMVYYGDRFRLEQVVHNFLSNAVKYSPNGKKVLVDCKIFQENIIVSIQDFGIGIAQENLSKLFDRYFRVDNTATRFDGLGLGLFISSEILKRHQGNFWIESNENEGSTFYFGLPLDQSIATIISEKNHFQDKHIIIKYDDDLKLIHMDWKGFQNLKTVQNGCLLALEMLKKYGAKKILNDNTHVLGTWSEASEWVGTELFPQMEQCGLTHFAWIYSQSGFSQLSARKSVDVMIGNVTVQFFTEIEEAKKWLI